MQTTVWGRPVCIPCAPIVPSRVPLVQSRGSRLTCSSTPTPVKEAQRPASKVRIVCCCQSIRTPQCLWFHSCSDCLQLQDTGVYIRRRAPEGIGSQGQVHVSTQTCIGVTLSCCVNVSNLVRSTGVGLWTSKSYRQKRTSPAIYSKK